jgi:hypothetical protein
LARRFWRLEKVVVIIFKFLGRASPVRAATLKFVQFIINWMFK